MGVKADHCVTSTADQGKDTSSLQKNLQSGKEMARPEQTLNTGRIAVRNG